MSNEYKVGDEAELGPVRMNKFLSEVAAQGGVVELYGNKAKIVWLPEKPKATEPEPEPEVLQMQALPPLTPAQSDSEEPKKAAPRRKAAAPKSD